MNARARVVVVMAVLVGAALLAGPAFGDDPEARARTECSRGHEGELRVRVDEGRLQLELRVESPRLARWSVVLLHERRLAFRSIVRAARSGGLRLRRSLPDLYGRDRIVARATGPRGETCRLTVTI
jgi:hypothetical protein